MQARARHPLVRGVHPRPTPSEAIPSATALGRGAPSPGRGGGRRPRSRTARGDGSGRVPSRSANWRGTTGSHMENGTGSGDRVTRRCRVSHGPGGAERDARCRKAHTNDSTPMTLQLGPPRPLRFATRRRLSHSEHQRAELPVLEDPYLLFVSWEGDPGRAPGAMASGGFRRLQEASGGFRASADWRHPLCRSANVVCGPTSPVFIWLSARKPATGRPSCCKITVKENLWSRFAAPSTESCRIGGSTGST
jgi:hypothetical protein